MGSKVVGDGSSVFVVEVNRVHQLAVDVRVKLPISAIAHPDVAGPYTPSLCPAVKTAMVCLSAFSLWASIYPNPCCAEWAMLSKAQPSGIVATRMSEHIEPGGHPAGLGRFKRALLDQTRRELYG